MSERAKQIEQIAVISVIALLVIGSIMMILPSVRAILWALVGKPLFKVSEGG